MCIFWWRAKILDSYSQLSLEWGKVMCNKQIPVDWNIQHVIAVRNILTQDYVGLPLPFANLWGFLLSSFYWTVLAFLKFQSKTLLQNFENPQSLVWPHQRVQHIDFHSSHSGLSRLPDEKQLNIVMLRPCQKIQRVKRCPCRVKF